MHPQSTTASYGRTARVLALACSVVLGLLGLVPHAAAAQTKPMTITGVTGTRLVFQGDDGPPVWGVDFTVKNTGTVTAWVIAWTDCGPFTEWNENTELYECPWADREGNTYVQLAPGQTGTVTAQIAMQTQSTGTISLSVAASPWGQWWFDLTGPIDTRQATVTVSNWVPSATLALPAISSFQPTVTPKGTTATIARGTASSRTFTVQNVGSLQATYSLAVACGGMAGCSANKSTTTLDPGATDNVVVSFTTPTTFGASNAATLTATYTNANNQSIADNASVTVTTPVGQPSVAPKAGAAVTQQDGDLATFQVTNTGTALAQFSFAAACDTWAVSCYVWDVPTVWIGPNETVAMHVAFSGGGVLGSPTASPAHVRLIASLAADGAVVAVDTGTVSATRAYYKVNFASKTIAVTDSAIFGQTKTVTLTNTGNAAAYYSIAMTCTGVSGCSGPPSVWLLPGVATTFSYFHNGPAHVGQSGTIRFIATRAGGPAPADADTAVVTATAGDFLPPQVQIWQPGSGGNGSVVTTRSVTGTVWVCDVDGTLTQPSPVTLNGVTVTGSVAPYPPGACNTAQMATYSLLAQPGSNAFVFGGRDGTNTTTVTRTFTYDETVEHTPVVTANTATETLASSRAASDGFVVRNPGSLTVTYALTASCGASATGCVPSPASVTLAGGQTAAVSINYTTSSVATFGSVVLTARYTGANGQPVYGSASTAVTTDAAAPTAVITGPAPNSTIGVLPNLSVAWCDADGTLATHTVTLDGTPLTDTFVSQTQSGCTTAGTSSWSNVSLTLGAHTVTATATDAAGHVTTTSLTFTLALPAIAAFQPDVTPRTATPSLIPNEQTLTWAVRNVGTLSAQYQLTADCTAITTTSGCSLDKPIVTLAPGAVDSVRMTFVLTGWPSTSKTLKLSARYTDIVGRVTADTAVVTAQIPNMATLYQPEVRQPAGTLYQEPNVIQLYTFWVTNRGIAPVTYHMDEAASAPFTIYVPYVNDTLTVLPGQTAYYQVQVRSPIATGATGQVTISASYTFDGQTVSSTMVTPVATRATTLAVLITNQAGTTQNASGATGSTTFLLTNIGVGLVEGELAPAVSICNGMIFNCRYAPRGDGRTISLAPSASTMVTVLFDIVPASTGSTFGAMEIEFDGKPGTPSAFLQRYGSVFILRSLVADGVDVTPDNLPLRYDANQTDRTYPFVIRNTGTAAAWFDYTITCAGAPGSPSAVTCASVSGQTRQLAQDEADTVTAHFNTTAADTVGYVTLTATKVGNASTSDVGTLAVRLSAIAGISVAARSADPGTAIAKGQCLTVAAGEAAAYECGDLRLVHPLPATTTMNKARAPMLIYNSAHVRPFVFLGVDVTYTGQATPRSVLAIVKLRGSNTELGRQEEPWNAPCAGATCRIVVPIDAIAKTLTQGVYDYTMQIQVTSPTAGVVLAQQSFDSSFVVVDRSTSPFGAGWWLDGVEQLVHVSDATKLVVLGDGSTRRYVQSATDATVFTVQPAVDRPDTLTRFDSAGGTYWRRHLRNAAYVQFDNFGRHVATVNTVGWITRFGYVGGLKALQSITLPVPGGAATGPRYVFDYYLNTDGSPRVLHTVTAPMIKGANGGATTPRQTVVTPRTLNGQVDYFIQSIQDDASRPGSLVAFAPSAVGGYTIGTRVNRRQSQATFSFDPAYGKLTRVDVTNDYRDGAGNQLAKQPTSYFCASETRTLASCTIGSGTTTAVGLTSGDLLFTVIDGPRTDSVDVTQILVNPWGAPTKVVDAYQAVTTIDRMDTRFPMLATAVHYPGGRNVTAHYTDRGLIDVQEDDAAADLTGVSGDLARTTYQWHTGAAGQPSYDLLTSSTSPRNVTTTFEYYLDPSERRFRSPKAQYDGRGSASAVTFDYYYTDADAAFGGLTKSTTMPTVAGGAAPAPEQYFYDANLGNLIRVQSPRGTEHRMGRDSIGRVVKDSTQIDRAGQRPTIRWQTDSSAFDVLDRVVHTLAFGPDSTQNKQVETDRNYDDNGQLLGLTRWGTQSQFASITAKWTFDLLGHQITAETEEATPVSKVFRADTTLYDAAGNAWHTRNRNGYAADVVYDRMNRPRTRTSDPVSTAQSSTGIPGLTQHAHPEWNLWLPYPYFPNTQSGAYQMPGETVRFTYDVTTGFMTDATNSTGEVHRDYYKNGLLKTERQSLRAWGDATGPDAHTYTIGYAYDKDGSRKSVTYPSVLQGPSRSTVDYTYNATTGLLETVTDLSGQSFTFGYDFRNQRRHMAMPGGWIDSLTFDDEGLLARHYLRAPGLVNGLPVYPRSESFTDYDARGRLLRSNDLAGLRLDLTNVYDGLGQLRTSTSIADNLTADTLPSRLTTASSFTLDALGNLLETRQPTFANTALDVYREVTSETGTAAVNSYDGAGRMTLAQTSATKDTLSYDASGNIVFRTRKPLVAGGSVTSPSDVRSYYDADNRLRAIDTRAYSEFTSSWYSRTFEEYRYDALGRRVEVRSRRACWGVTDQLYYRYTGDATELDCQVSTIRRTVWDGSSELGELQGPGEDGASLEVDGPQPFHANPVTSTQANVGRNLQDINHYFGSVAYTRGLVLDQPLSVLRKDFGDAVTAADFMRQTISIVPFWNARGQMDAAMLNGTTGVPLCVTQNSINHCAQVEASAGWYPYARQRFVPHAWNGSLLADKQDASGQMYRRNRYYDPATGRFTQEDPIGLAGGMNLYGFANGDPANFSDPFGLCGEKNEKPCPHEYNAQDAAVVMRQLSQMAPAINHDVAWFLPNNIASALSGIALGGVVGRVLGWIGARAAGSAAVAGTEDAITLYHQGNLAGGRVLATRSLSTSLSSDLAHYAPDEALQTFQVPRAVFQGWDKAGYVTRLTDLFRGVVTSEIRIQAGASGELNKYLIKP